MTFRTCLLLLALALAGDVAAETVNCTNITSLPSTITTQGVYCLKQDLTTAIASGSAITVNANNVTIDCNGYKLGGQAAGLATTAAGISTSSANVVVRNCNIRGFGSGVSLSGSGHLVEDNRFDGNTIYAIYLIGDGITARRNLIFDTGGNTSNSTPFGIYAIYNTDILGNSISNVSATAASGSDAYGIYTDSNSSGTIANNLVRNVSSDGAGVPRGIYNYSSSRVSIRDNNISNATATGTALRCTDSDGMATGNHLLGYATTIDGCTDGGSNVSN